MIDGWNEELTEEGRDELIEKIASGIVGRGMETPAVLFLEMHKPLSFAASQSLIVTSPLIAPFVGIERLQIAAQVLRNRDNVERLICRIEELAVQKRPRKGGHRT